jgi:hypothetical protein
MRKREVLQNAKKCVNVLICGCANENDVRMCKYARSPTIADQQVGGVAGICTSAHFLHLHISPSITPLLGESIEKPDPDFPGELRFLETVIIRPLVDTVVPARPNYQLRNGLK